MVTLCSSGQGTTSDRALYLKKTTSGKRLDAIFGQVLLLRWCLIFAFLCGPVRPLWPFPSPVLSRAGVAPLPPGFHKLLSVTVTTFAVFPSWMYLLGGDDNRMLSVPSSTSDLHIRCWQSGEICQAMAAAAFTLFRLSTVSSSKRR